MLTIEFVRYMFSGVGILFGIFLITMMLDNRYDYVPKSRDLYVGVWLGLASCALNLHDFFFEGQAVFNLKFLLLLFLCLKFSWRTLATFAPLYLIGVYYSPFSIWYALALLAIAIVFWWSKIRKEIMAALLLFCFVPVVFSEIHINSYLGRYDAEVILTLAVAASIAILFITLVITTYFHRNYFGSVFLSRFFLELLSKFDHLYFFWIDTRKKEVFFSRKGAEDLELQYTKMPLYLFENTIQNSTEKHLNAIANQIEKTLFSTPATGQEMFIEYICYGSMLGGYLGLIRDITKQTSRNEVLYRAKARDYITGFPGYPVMKEGVLEYCSKTTDFVLFASIRLNLDFQKSTVYETEFEMASYKTIAAILRQNFPHAEIYSIKTGEFLFLMQESMKDGHALKGLQRLQEVFQGTYEVQEKQFAMKAKIGAIYLESLRIQNLSDVDELLKKLTFCKYRSDAQEAGGFYLFVPSQYEEYLQRFLRLRYLPGILQRGDFSLVFQPIVHIATRKIIFLETLIRVQHEVYGNTGDFINDCIAAGYDIELDRMIFRKMQEVVRNGQITNDISVNILGNTPVLDEMIELSRLLQQQGNQLFIELTEHIYNKPEEVLVKAAQLKKFGIQIIADDYGTGFSNNIMLARVRFDGLKIPIDLMSNILSDEKAYFMIKSIRDYCENLRILCIAEGIETEEQVGMLNEMNIHLAQGYYFAKPQPIETLDVTRQAGDSK